jgi:hypothetical protein
MSETRYTYEIVIPKLGLLNNEFVVCIASTPEMAGEVVRILLATQDRSITWVTVRAIPTP